MKGSEQLSTRKMGDEEKKRRSDCLQKRKGKHKKEKTTIRRQKENKINEK